MDEKLAAAIARMPDFAKLRSLEENARKRDALSNDLESAIKARGIELGRDIVVKGAGLDVSDLSPAEEKILRAASEYTSVKHRLGSHSGRTVKQIRENGLIEAAEASVTKSKATQGFETLTDEDLGELSYEQIVIDHPEEFSTRALWHARRRLGLENASDKAPAKSILAAQRRTVELLEWLRERARANDGLLGEFSNADAAAALGFTQLQNEGRAFGNIVSRIDFACYRLGLPPLGLAVVVPFKNAWQTDGSWKFPIVTMAAAAKSYHWRDHDFARILGETETYPGLAHFMWKAEPIEPVRSWAQGLEHGPRESIAPSAVAAVGPGKLASTRNPDWTLEEHTLALDLYMRLRGTTYPDEHPEVVRLSQNLKILARLRGMSGNPEFRNANGVSMKMQNFRRLDPEYAGVGLNAGAAGEELVWGTYADDPAALAAAAAVLMAEIDTARDDDGMTDLAPSVAPDGQYWVFVNNPAKWAIDRFLETGKTEDKWGINPHDQTKFFPGQLGFIRVGVDARSNETRQGRPKLEPGIYALVEVETVVFPGSGASDEYWDEGAKRDAGWPTVRLRYLRNYLGRPLTIERLKRDLPDISSSLLNGRQASSFALSADDFHAVMALLDEDTEQLPDPTPPAVNSLDLIAEAEKKYVHASPEVKSRVSRTIERGSIGNLMKKVNGYKCQLCESLGHNPLGFKKRKNGQHYVEAHHVMPVSTRQAGVLSASNVMTLCANHHREAHYGDLEIEIKETCFRILCDGQVLKVPRSIISDLLLTAE